MILNNMGQCFREGGRLTDALDSFHSAISLLKESAADEGKAVGRYRGNEERKMSIQLIS